ncbi:hypothetical protein MCP_2331 [Methanocella paludicola SANAE]|uniref:Lipoprotein n=1 Tax=Methanocella paludicola (strain DSM 17711 / JCM 13418 / NBRC 101707 / SANAE) TaxID=304371 RepID=D1Z131_METPS|nr:hypothetical protein [Methanocella paludicola]BAI62403.1 hypothetical protein MCP_2331 [Methanocella paludicola SANAE]
MKGKGLVVLFLVVMSFVAVSGCSDLYNILETYVPTVTPEAQTPVRIGDVAPSSTVKDITITGSGNTITFRGLGKYNVNDRNDYFTLNQGKADFSIDLKGQGAWCIITMECINPYTGSKEYMTIYEFTLESRQYKFTKQVDIPYTAKYCLSVNYYDSWEIKITQ